MQITIIIKLKTLQMQIEKYTYRPPNQTIINCHTFKERSKTHKHHKEVIKQEKRLFGEEDIRRMCWIENKTKQQKEKLLSFIFE